MPSFIANRLYPPINVIPIAIPPFLVKGMLFLETPIITDPMLFLNGDPMLFLGA